MKIKLIPTDEQKNMLLKTMEQFNEACNKISKIAYEQKAYDKVKLQKICYYKIRDEFKLPAQLAIRAISKVAESYKVNMSTLHKFGKYGAIVYDSRLLSYKKSLDKVSISTLEGRIKVPIVYGSYANLGEKIIKGQSDLIYIKTDLFLCSIIEVPEETTFMSKNYLGVNLSTSNIATTSDNIAYSGEKMNQARQRFTKLRTILNKVGTKSAKRHLKKISGKERRFKTNTNHIISKEIVNVAKGTKRAIVMEKPVTSRARITVRKVQHDEQYGTWAFSQLRHFIEYKAKLAGVPLIFVDLTNNLSNQCSTCGYIDDNNAKTFLLRAAVNKPIVVSKRL